jgi:hypothetical protein
LKRTDFFYVKRNSAISYTLITEKYHAAFTPVLEALNPLHLWPQLKGYPKALIGELTACFLFFTQTDTNRVLTAENLY